MAKAIIDTQQKQQIERLTQSFVSRLVERLPGRRCDEVVFVLPEPDFIPLEANADLALMSALCG